MKQLRIFLLLLSINLLFLNAKAQNSTTQFSEGYSIQEMERLIDELTFTNHRSVLKKMNFEYTGYNTEDEVHMYEKPDETELYVYYKDKKITHISFFAGKIKYLTFIGKLGTTEYLIVKRDGENILFKKGNYFVSVDPVEFMVTINKDNSTQNNSVTTGSWATSTSNGYTMRELHELADLITYNNHTAELEKRGMKHERDDTEKGHFIYRKNDDVRFFVIYKDAKVTAVHFISSAPNFYRAQAEIHANRDFVKTSEKPFGSGKLTYYSYKGHQVAVNDVTFRITMWPKVVVETYNSAKEFADAANQNIKWARLNFDTPTYKFDVKGSINMDRPSVRFITKQNVLYIQMNIPRNGDCDYGLKEVKAKWTGGGTGDGYFYYRFAYEYECGSNKYSNIYIEFNNSSSSFTYAGLEAWLRNNAH